MITKAPTSMIDPTGAASGNVLTYNSSTNTWVASAVPLNLPTGANGQILTYSGTTNAWVASAAPATTPTVLSPMEPAVGLGGKGWSHYGSSFYTKNEVYVFGYNWNTADSGKDAAVPTKLIFQENYTANNPNVTIKKVFDSVRHTIVLLTDGTLWAAGNLSNIFNLYTVVNSGSLVKLNGLFANRTVVDFSYSASTDPVITLGILCSDNTAYAWGYNGHSQLGNGTTTTSTTPVQINIPGKTVAQISVAGWGGTTGNILVRMTDGTLYACGYNAHGQLGVGDTVGKSSFTQCKENSTTFVTNVSAICEVQKMQGGYTRYVIKNNGTLWGTGLNDRSQLGDGTTTSSNFYKQIGNLSNIQKVVTTGWSTNTTVAALNTSGQVYTWGYAGYGATGTGSSTNITTPTLVSVYRNTPVSDATLPPIRDIFGADCSNVGSIGLISTSNQLFIAGINTFSPVTLLNNGSKSTDNFYRFELAAIQNVEEAAFYNDQLSNGGGTTAGTIVRDREGSIWAWGYNSSSILNSNPNPSHTPIRIHFRNSLGINLNGTNGQVMTYNGSTNTWAASSLSTQGFAASLTPNGYTYLPNGLIMQWGAYTSGITENTSSIVTFPIPFNVACFSVVATTRNTAASFRDMVAHVVSYNRTSFTYLNEQINSAQSDDGVNWFAIGC